MDYATIGIQHAFMHHFTKRRVREDGVHEFGFGGFQSAANDVALDHLSHLSAHHMGSQEFSGFGVEHCFDQTFGLAQRDGFAIADEWESADIYVIPQLFGLGF